MLINKVFHTYLNLPAAERVTLEIRDSYTVFNPRLIVRPAGS